MEPHRLERATRRRIAVRLLPFVFLMYVICYVDRVNVSVANLRMSAHLAFSDRIFGLGAGIFSLNSIGHIGGFIGPYAVGRLNDRTASLLGAFLLIAICYLMAGAALALIRIPSSISSTAARLSPEQDLALS